MKVCIPSKDRADSCTTHLMFDPGNVLIFVEPQEIEKYKFFHPEYTFVNIEKNDKGVSYARNYILDYMGDVNLIMADDDYIAFGKRNKEGRYDCLKNPKEVIIELEKNLKKFQACCIADILFGYYVNKNSNKRFYINQNKLYDFYSLNGKWLKQHNIRYDENLKEGEDLDLTIMILINNGNIATDYMYSKETIHLFFEGGLEKERKKAHEMNIVQIDNLQRRYIDYLVRKYGPEFFTISHDSYGNIKSCRFKQKVIMKRLDIIKQRIENFKSRNIIK